ncbi:3-oxoacyl-[acyl-carrier-protein] reductase FabG [Streptomyces sp. ADI92-24]|uniref:3-oxoacyl-[acyl-carrier-protein] reductase n=1 Tax=unclassified Streptomyces TaxID=2593676 RepID=UPI000FC268CC|nr:MULTISPECIES: 3-oxoacyl-[acyl-carrier-protein] reductase [unclassified Streptomyces]MCX4775231.1 3-oxoacyl-[acyl-carrier-protein] reductase [Streptomyces sp. NBC_01285]ROQ65354.1 3-oxoacyl-[acyl-carrier-protein] reductase [Streptomyces sp. CEV 2-1]RPK32916.1 3-oxoacyl-[acyl-carrier-protein] reductase FabG [Streptomyces sp. ADI92-24]
MPDTQRPVALVSGGSRGIGRAVVSRLAHDGFDVAFCYRSNAEAAARTVEEATGTGARVIAHRVDVASLEEVRAFTAAVENELGPLDAVVTSAGLTRDNSLLRMSDEDWREVMGTNLDGTYNVCRAAIFSFMKRRTGCVVTLSSITGVHGHAGQTNYAASKAGIIGFTKSLAKECGKYGVRANVVAPGLIETDMTAGLTEAARKDILDSVPLGRLGRPDDVADLVSFLVSDRARYISGQVLGVDGGLVI